MTRDESLNDGSPFHKGEQIIQARVGKREKMEGIGRRVIRSFMPDQHRAFYATLPFVVVGSVDDDGWPWASLLSGNSGFIASPDPTTLVINARAISNDPLAATLKKIGASLGLLGIELPTRRRNRLNGRIASIKEQFFSLTVDQSYGNCAQYIHKRGLDFIRDPKDMDTSEVSPALKFTALDDHSRTIIARADTFFVASYIKPKERPEIEGVDVSHRGGQAGFVRVDGNVLTIPDYSGNYHFNTLGNFLMNPKAGLVFIDFTSGDLLMLTGTVTLLWEDEPQVSRLKGAERAWCFTLSHGVRLRNALPLSAKN